MMSNYGDSPEQRRGELDMRFIMEYAPQIANDYNREWIAVWAFEIIDHDTDVRALRKRIDYERYPNPVIRFMDKALV